MTYATFKHYKEITGSKYTRVSIFGEQMLNGKCKITILTFNPKDKVFSKKKGWEEYNTGKYPSQIIAGIYDQNDFIRWCNTYYYQETNYILPGIKILKINKLGSKYNYGISGKCLQIKCLR